MTTETALRDTLSAAAAKMNRARSYEQAGDTAGIIEPRNMAREARGEMEAVRRIASLLGLEEIVTEAVEVAK